MRHTIPPPAAAEATPSPTGSASAQVTPDAGAPRGYCRTDPDAPSAGERAQALAVLGLTEEALAHQRYAAIREEVPLPAAVERYLASLRLRNLSPLTIREYQRELGDFAAFAMGRGVGGRDAGEVQPTLVSTYLQARRSRRPGHNHRRRGGTVSATRQRWRHTVLHRFFQWCRAELALERNPVLAHHRARQTQDPEIPHLTESQARTCLRAASGTRQPMRDRVIMRFFIATGARLGEVARLQLGDLHLEEEAPYVVLHGKGDRTRCVVLDPTLVGLLQELIAHRRHTDPQAGAEAPLFVTHGQQGGYRALSRVGVGKLLGRIFAAAQAAEADLRSMRLHPHVLRHTFASQLARHGVQVFTLQRALGHRDVTTTQGYVHLTLREQALELQRRGAFAWLPPDEEKP